MLYLDNSATTYILPDVQEKMITYITKEYGNPSSKYYDLAENAKKAVEDARNILAQLLNTHEDEIIFTSGATESNNMIIKGVADYYQDQGNHIITSKAEHSSVIKVCEFLESKGFEVTYLDVDRFGRIDLEQLQNAITPATILVSLIWGNNELGSLNNMKDIANICREADVYLHTDATQVVGKHELDLLNYDGISFLSCSAHKMHGPKGAGLVFIRKDKYGQLIPITPLLHGGEQEPFRSGTYAVQNIVGFGEAAKIAKKYMHTNIQQLNLLENKLTKILKNKFGNNIAINTDEENKVPGIINIQFIGIKNQILLKKIAPLIAASTGSACSTTKPSHVLKAIGLSKTEIQESVRFSLSPYTDLDEIEIFNEL